jgi:UDP-glucuronate 4-epimerase
MAVLVTGVAGFIGYHVAQALLGRGEEVIGVDNLNDYYEVSLKEDRLARLEGRPGFSFRRLDIADHESVFALFAEERRIDRVVHMAAQAGVRYSLTNPYAYIRSNIEGHVVLLEAARRLPRLAHFVYASSSSVYGDNRDMPFSVTDRTDRPVSLYGATKKAMEVISESYSAMYSLSLTGLRFFTVYGPWGRPDMAYFSFTRKILAGEPIPVFNNGDMRRDFTYIDDIVAGVLNCLDQPPDGNRGAGNHRLYNLGNHRPESLLEFISTLESALRRKAFVELLPMQLGDVKDTCADIEASRRDLNFEPKTSIADGIPRSSLGSATDTGPETAALGV